MTPELYPAPPEHPHAAALLTTLERLRALFDGWRWDVIEGDLAVVTYLRHTRVSLRVWIHGGVINLDVWCAAIDPDLQRLTWLLAQNLGQPFKARATWAQDRLQIYLTRDVSLGARDDLDALLWDAYEAALTTNGRLMQVIPAPTADHHA